MAKLARHLVLLRRAAEVLGEPVYIFGDDFADYFMQLAHSPEEMRKCNLVFIAEGRDLPAALVRYAAGNSLEFTAEYRLGFGFAPNSKIAQDFMEAFLAIFRAEMDRRSRYGPTR